MTKTIILCLSLLIITATAGVCQSIKNDSITHAAKRDAKHFKLDKPLWKQFKQQHFANTSDYFKPKAADVSNVTLLNDSAYVKAYRLAAYNRTLHRHGAGHYVLVGGGIAVGTFATVIAAILIFIAPTME